MEILNQRNIIGRTKVREESIIFERILYSDKTVKWNPISYDGECDEEELEKKFQDLINKPVETTNEQPKLTIKEFCFLRDLLYGFNRTLNRNAEEFFSKEENRDNMIEKLRRLMV